MPVYVICGLDIKPTLVEADYYETSSGGYERTQYSFYKKLEKPTPWQKEKQVAQFEGHRISVTEAK